MATHNLKSPPVKGKARRRSDLTVMIAGPVGKIRTFRISSGFLFWTALFFALFIVASIVFINMYFEERRSSKTQMVLLKGLKHEIEVTKRQLYRSRQRLALLEDTIYERREDQEEASGEKEGDGEKVQDEGLEGKEDSVEDFAEVPEERVVEVKGLRVRRDGPRLNVLFRLTNANRGHGAVSGYVHIIAMNKDSDPPQTWAYPKVALRDGLPIDFKQGKLFSIKRFRRFRAEYFIDSGIGPPDSVKVLVYDEAGEVILEKEYEFKDVS